MLAQEHCSLAPQSFQDATLAPLAPVTFPGWFDSRFCHVNSLLRATLPIFFLCASVETSAFGLGDVLSVSNLGERLNVRIAILPQAGQRPEVGCVHFSKPQIDDGTPWLQNGSLSILKAHPPVLLVTSRKRIVEPTLRIALNVGCGHNVQRDYTILLSPPVTEGIESVATPTGSNDKSPKSASSNQSSSKSSSADVALRTSKKPLAGRSSRDVLVLSSNEEPVEASLRLTHTLSSWNKEAAGNDRQRTLLRMEYRLLQALYEQTLAQLDTTEKVRKVEASIEKLEQQVQAEAVASAQKTETTPTTQTLAVEETTSTTLAPEASPAIASPISETAEKTPDSPPSSNSTTTPQVIQPEATKSAFPWKTTFFFLFLFASVVAIWLASKHYRSQSNQTRRRPSRKPPEPVITTHHFDDLDEFDEPRIKKPRYPNQLKDNAEASTLSPIIAPSELSLSQFSMGSPTIEEHFEANPVMELAEIMLSFGRVKGAAQALQEFIDSNPEESLQPWIRLMDVYRMAGMRSEFERVAAELNQHFNVEIQLWDEIPAELPEEEGEVPAIEPNEWPKMNRKATNLEEAEHIADRIVTLWPQKECSEFLDQLLRSNRGGLRSGFSRSVVEEIMFLIELQATIEKMVAEANGN